MIHPLRITVAAVAALTASGCIQRTITVDSEPRGALVYLNDEEVGRTPVIVPFTFYGTYDVRLEKEGFATLAVEQQARGPWWEAPGPDLIAEAIPGNKVQLHWFYTLTPSVAPDEADLLERARQLREQALGTAPAVDSPADSK
jgi:hypothetical protein